MTSEWFRRFGWRSRSDSGRLKRLERRLRYERPWPNGASSERMREALFERLATGRGRERLRGWSLVAGGLALLIVALLIAAS